MKRQVHPFARCTCLIFGSLRKVWGANKGLGEAPKAARGRSMKARPTQSRGGVKGQCPLQGQGTASLVGFGATPQLFHGRPVCPTRSTKGAGSEASLPVTKKPSNIVQVTWEATAEGVQRAIGKPSGTMPTTSLIEKSTLAVQKSRYFSLLQGFRLCGGDKGALRSPP